MKTISIIFFLLLFQVSFSQKEKINKIYVQSSIQKMKFQYEDENGKLFSDKYNIYLLSLHLQYLDFIESGIYTSIRPYFNRYTYQQKIQLLPLIIDKKKSRVNCYLNGTISFAYIPNEKSLFYRGFTFGIGSSINITKNWGAFGEYNLFSSFFSNKPYLQFGISYNWDTTKDE